MFTIPGYNKFKVEGDDDVQNMLSLAKSFGLDHIDVLIQMRNNVSGSQLGSEGSLHDIPSNNTDWRTADMEDRTNLLLDYCTHKKKTYLSAGWAFGITKVGQSFFGGAHEFRMVLCKYAVECGFQFKYMKNDLVRVTAVCKFTMSTGCAWLIHSRVSASNGIFCLKKFNLVYSYGAAVRTYRNPQTGSDLVADVIACHVREQPLTRPTDVVFDMKDGYGLDISYRIAWLGMEKAYTEVFGDHDMSFDQLRWYSDAVMHNNPRSYIDLEFEQQTGCFVRLILVAFAIVDSENTCNWEWFLSHLSEVIDYSRNLTFMNLRDRMKYINADKKNGLLRKLRECVYAPTVNSFNQKSRYSITINSGKNIYDAIESFYHIDEYKAVYGGSIHPIPTVGKPNFSVANYLITPPVYKRPPGRPKRKRIPSKGEITKRIRCGRCGKMGHHNRKTCKEPM
ncbi:hypothetical protein ACSBR1_019796 [Camellia fascicularis]